jgi:hypothetical protein
MAHEMSDYIDSVKESLTDAQYKEGMELCQKIFTQNEKKLYTMTFLRPYTFEDDHCDDADCMDSKFFIAFTKASSLVLLTEEQAKTIEEEHLYHANAETMKAFIDLDVFRAFPRDNEELGSELEWYEFPVISLTRE